MTYQLPDTLIYAEHEYRLVSILDEKNFFDVASLGITINGCSTANYSGRLARFAVVDDELLLKDLAIRTSQSLPINNVLPRKITIKEQVANFGDYYSEFGSIFLGGDNYYLDLNIPVEYTGKLLIADDFIKEYRVNGIFDSPLEFRKNLLLIVEEGLVFDVIDVSNIIEKERKRRIITETEMKNFSNNSDVFKLFIKE